MHQNAQFSTLKSKKILSRPIPSGEEKHQNEAQQSVQFQITAVCKNSTQNAPFSTQKSKNFLGDPFPYWGGETPSHTGHTLLLGASVLMPSVLDHHPLQHDIPDLPL